MPAAKPTSDELESVCSFCGHRDRYEIARGVHDLSPVGRGRVTFPPVVRITLSCKSCRAQFFHAVVGARRIVGYHGCSLEFARKITTPGVDIEEWRHSENAWEWLGDGVYFWEEAPLRAREWAELATRRKEGRTEPAVVGAVIAPQTLVDFGDTEFADQLAEAYHELDKRYKSAGKPLPVNRPFRHDPADSDNKFRELDRLVVTELVARIERRGDRVEAVRAPFEEGPQAYQGAGIYVRSHVQVVVRDLARIRYVWMVPPID